MAESFERYNASCSNLIYTKDFEKLHDKVEEDLAKDPENPIYWTMKGYTLRELGRHEEAVKALEKAIELDDSLLYAHSNIAIALGDLNRWEEVIKHCDKIMEIEPKTHAHFMKAVALFELGRNEEAETWLMEDIKEWEDWLADNPDAFDQDKVHAYFWLINNYHTLEDYKKELEYFDKMWALLTQEAPPRHAVEYRKDLLRLAKEKEGGKGADEKKRAQSEEE